MSTMANYWITKDWQITLLTFVDSSKSPFYDLDKRICYIPLAIAKNSSNPIIAIWNNCQRIKILRTAIINSKPDAIISFLDITNVTTLLATKWLKIPTIVSERNDPNSFPIISIWKKLRQWTYPFADAVVVQTQRALKYFSPQLQSQIYIVPNPVLLPSKNDNLAKKLLNKPSLIAMGRLEKQKGFDILLQAFTKIKDYYPEWTLTILGEGTLREELENLREKLGLSDRVYFPGRVNNPTQFLKQANIFVMSSRFEGFPNALCEAMACGLPVISTDCPSGPREIIRDGVDGILIPNEDVTALAAAMERLMGHEEERKYLASYALEITNRFSLEKVMNNWEEILQKVTKK
jgi:glycosyltransferase involved in cell wall biosynthesis